jgi:hypothetical protein
MVARGFADPRRSYPGQAHLDVVFTDSFTFWQDQDPSPKPQQRIPNSTVRWIARTFGTTTQGRLPIIADLIVVAYFFLLRVCEYTKSRRATRTVPLRRQDIQLWRGGAILLHTASLADLLQATSATINLENQKNGIRGSAVHHESSGDPDIDPVRSLARLVHYITALPPDTPLGTFTTANRRPVQVSPSDIAAMLKGGAIGDNLVRAGYDIARIGTHSLRSGGAINLAINGIDHAIIMKIGRWSSNTYLRYIQSQIGELSHGLSAAMARPMRFHRVGR